MTTRGRRRRRWSGAPAASGRKLNSRRLEGNAGGPARKRARRRLGPAGREPRAASSQSGGGQARARTVLLGQLETFADRRSPIEARQGLPAFRRQTRIRDALRAGLATIGFACGSGRSGALKRLCGGGDNTKGAWPADKHELKRKSAIEAQEKKGEKKAS